MRGDGMPPQAPPSQKAPQRKSIKANVDMSEIVRRQLGPAGFKVIEFLPQAVARDREDLVSPQSLGIHPRDLSLFQTGRGMATQRATITVRENSIFIRTEAVGVLRLRT